MDKPKAVKQIRAIAEILYSKSDRFINFSGYYVTTKYGKKRYYAKHYRMAVEALKLWRKNKRGFSLEEIAKKAAKQ